VIGFRLINCKHAGDNIADSIANVVEDFGLSDKVFAVTLDNASANAKAYKILGPVLFGYLGSYPTPTRDDPDVVKYFLVQLGSDSQLELIGWRLPSLQARIFLIIYSYKKEIPHVHSSPFAVCRSFAPRARARAQHGAHRPAGRPVKYSS
jgi:hypothetical protein